MYLIYSALLALALLLSLPYWLWRMFRDHIYRAGLTERLGRIPGRLLPPVGRNSIWVHAVSVGEVLAVSRLIGELQRSYPQHRVFVSTTTDTGYRLAGQRFGQENVFYFP